MRDRVFGMETEYAILFEPRDACTERPSARAVFDLVEQELKARFRTLPSSERGKRGLFLENGALVTFESTDWVNGLLELSTPECRTASEATLHQAALDVLARDLAIAVTRRLHAGPNAGTIRFGKNSADGKGHTYGTHENYYVDDPSPVTRWGDRLQHLACRAAWRLALVWVQALSWTLAIGSISVFLMACVVGAMLLGCAAAASGLLRLLLGRFGFSERLREVVPVLAATLQRSGGALAAVLDNATQRLLGWLAPLSIRPGIVPFDRFLTRATMHAFTENLAAYLATRSIWCGSGRLWLEPIPSGSHETSPRRLFTLSARAARTTRVAGASTHPCYMFDLKSLIGNPTCVASRHKRLEIICGDSNMSEMCVFMKLGVTGLLIRMIEEGERFDDLALSESVHSMRDVAADASLTTEVRLAGGGSKTALAIQRAYLTRATAFYATRDTDEETRHLLTMWARTLDALEHDPSSLASQVDWIAKYVLMREIAAGGGCSVEDLEVVAPFACEVVEEFERVIAGWTDDEVRERLQRHLPRARFSALRQTVGYHELAWTRVVTLSHIAFRLRRLDLRYHEIGEVDGPWDQLRATGSMRWRNSELACRAALLEPPEGTRAVRRAELVRRYAGEAAPRMAIAWDRFRGPSRQHDCSLGGVLLAEE